VSARTARAVLAWLTGAFAVLTPALAAACPACASRQDGGVGQTVALGALLIVPFTVSAVVYRYIRAQGGGAAEESPTSGATPSSTTKRSGTE
jgi:hypothetical protein